MCCLHRWRKKIGPVPQDIVEEDTFHIPILEGHEDMRLFESHISKYRSHMSLTFMGIRGDEKLYYTYAVHDRFVILRNALTFDLECLEKNCGDDVLIEKCKNMMADLNGIYKMKMY